MKAQTPRVNPSPVPTAQGCRDGNSSKYIYVLSSLCKKGLALDGVLFPNLCSLCLTSLLQVPVEQPQSGPSAQRTGLVFYPSLHL